jgi:protein-disulfide isomerase
MRYIQPFKVRGKVNIMQARQARQTRRESNVKQQRTILIIGIIAVIAVIVAVLAILISNNSVPTASPSAYTDVPQSRTQDGGFVLGDPDAPVTIIEFADFACPHCQDYAPDIAKFVHEYVFTGKAKFEYRMFISAADPTYGPYTAQLAECTDTLKPGTFFPAHDVLFELGSRARFNANTAKTLAERVGVDYGKLLNCAQNADQFNTDVKLGTGLGVQSTPTIMVRLGDAVPQFIHSGGQTWDRGPVPYELLVATVEHYQ